MTSTGSITPPVMVSAGNSTYGDAKVTSAYPDTKILPFNPDVLPFDSNNFTFAQIDPKGKLYPLIVSYATNHLTETVTRETSSTASYLIGEAKKTSTSCRKKKGQRCETELKCCGKGNGNVIKKYNRVHASLGVGVFDFCYRPTAEQQSAEPKANDKKLNTSKNAVLEEKQEEVIPMKLLHQIISDPVGCDCGPQVKENLILFIEGHNKQESLKRFCDEIIRNSEVSNDSTFTVYRWHVRWKYWQTKQEVEARPIDSVILPKKTKTKLINDIEDFLSDDCSGFYFNHGIPYKRSYLFYGVPGSGKTSMIQSLAGKYNKNVCYLSPTHPELTDDDLKEAVENAPENSIIVLEDVDALFGKNREKKIKQSPLTFSGLLNALDGVGDANGLLYILTTNFVDKLDPALVRDGRVDLRIKFDYCTKEQMELMFNSYYPHPKGSGDDGTDEDTDDDDEFKLLGKMFAKKLVKLLGSDRKVPAAMLQGFFIKHRKSSAEKALARVKDIIKAVDEKKEQEEEDKEAKEKQDKKTQKGGEDDANDSDASSDNDSDSDSDNEDDDGEDKNKTKTKKKNKKKRKKKSGKNGTTNEVVPMPQQQPTVVHVHVHNN